MFDPLFARLANKYHLIAPDYPGFGHSDAPPPKEFAYIFNHIAAIMTDFVESLGHIPLLALHAGLRWTDWISHDSRTS
jgi:pimeloyl-ACP methyl ester carboxylesterase